MAGPRAALRRDGPVHAAEEFRAWADARRQKLRLSAYLLTGDWDLADDLVQECLVRVYSRWARLVRRGDPTAYALRIIANEFRSRARRRSFGEVVVSDPKDSGLVEDPMEQVDGDLDLVRSLRRLPEGQRTVLVLRYFADMSIADVAAALRTSEGNVKSQSSRGLTTLRQLLVDSNVQQGGRHE